MLTARTFSVDERVGTTHLAAGCCDRRLPGSARQSRRRSLDRLLSLIGLRTVSRVQGDVAGSDHDFRRVVRNFVHGDDDPVFSGGVDCLSYRRHGSSLGEFYDPSRSFCIPRGLLMCLRPKLLASSLDLHRSLAKLASSVACVLNRGHAECEVASGIVLDASDDKRLVASPSDGITAPRSPLQVAHLHVGGELKRDASLHRFSRALCPQTSNPNVSKAAALADEMRAR